MVDENTPLPTGYRATESAGADEETVDYLATLLAKSERPVVFAGSGIRGADAEALRTVAESLDAVVYLNAGARGALPHDHPLLGLRARSEAFAGCDLLLALGVDWDFRTGYGKKIADGATVVQVDAEPTRLGWNRPADLAVVADPGRVVAQLAALVGAEGFAREGRRAWTEEIQGREAAKLAAAETEAEAAHDDPTGDTVMPQRFGKEVGEFFGPDAVVAVDGGDIVSTTAKWLQVSTPGHVLEPGPAGTLGTDPGFALAAKVVHPDKTVGIVFGDGGFGFHGFEYDTFVRHNLPIVGVVGNDGVWNNIKTFHRMFYPDRVVASDLGRRPYHDVVTALGGHGELVTRPADLRPALDRARASGKPALVNVHIAETVRASSNYSG
jgi:acetolactate synthase-1/2/3 large subunit